MPFLGAGGNTLPIYIDTISMDSSILYFRVHSLNFINLNKFLYPKNISI